MKDSLKIYNSYTKQLEKWVPRQPNQASIYLCGPTVYSDPHLGHARSAIIVDVIVRYLRHLGHQVTYVRNITDVGHLVADAEDGEDKVLQQALKKDIAPMAIAQQYTYSYHNALEKLHVLPPTIEPRATGHVLEQIAWVERLIEAKYAYVVNGSVYFDLQKYLKIQPYGQLSGKKIADLRNERSIVKKFEKRYSHDFALWKKAPSNHLMWWPSPWGNGFPGWHIECTAMSQKYLGSSFDMHIGGIDLAFPHHECEIAQTMAVTGKLPARYWLHHNLVTIHKQKMSKSAGNFITLEECFTGKHPFFSRAYSPMVMRFFLLQAHYRNTIDLSDTALQTAQKAYYKLMNGLLVLKRLARSASVSFLPSNSSSELANAIQQAHEAAYRAMNHDFNTPKVISQLFQLCSYIQQIHHDPTQLRRIGIESWTLLQRSYIAFLQLILGLQPMDLVDVPTLLDDLINWYEEAKKQKNFVQVDHLRALLRKQALVIQDQPEGSDWYYTIQK